MRHSGGYMAGGDGSPFGCRGQGVSLFLTLLPFPAGPACTTIIK